MPTREDAIRYRLAQRDHRDRMPHHPIWCAESPRTACDVCQSRWATSPRPEFQSREDIDAAAAGRVTHQAGPAAATSPGQLVQLLATPTYRSLIADVLWDLLAERVGQLVGEILQEELSNESKRTSEASLPTRQGETVADAGESAAAADKGDAWEG